MSFFITQLGVSQDYAYKNYTTKDGLAGNHVYHAVQDKEGYLWFATETGVSRFDGKNFVNFTVEHGLPSNEILKLFVDSRGRVWMMPFGNEICYYYRGKIFNSKNDPLIRKIKIISFILDIKEDRNGTLFFIEQLNGLFAINNKGEIFYYNQSICCVTIGLNNRGELNLFAVQGDNQSFSNSAKIYSIDIVNRSISLRQINNNIKFKIDRFSQCLIGRNLFVYSSRKQNIEPIGDLCFNSDEFGVKFINFKQEVNSISQINDSICFINTVNGVIKYDFKHNICKERILIDENIVFSFYDKENTNWMLTSSNGVYKNQSSNIINCRTPGHFKRNENIVSLAFKDEKKYCVSSSSNFFEIKKSNDLKLLKSLSLDSKKHLIKMKIIGNEFCFLFEHNLVSMELDKSRTIKAFKNYPLFSLKDFVFDSKRGYFISSHLGVFNSGLKNKNSKDFYLNERSTCMALIDSGIFIGTLSGLKFVNWKKSVSNLSESLNCKTGPISCLVVKDNLLWVGTNKNGLFRFEFKNHEVSISKLNLFQGNSIRCLFLDSNCLWVGTNNGLSKVSINILDTKLIKTYSIKDGFKSDVINDIHRIRDQVFVATDNGCSVINLIENPGSSYCYLPYPKITIANKIYTGDYEKIKLGPSQSINFVCDAIALKSEGDLVYCHRLLNLDSNLKSNQSNIIDFEFLPSGDYVFELFCIDRFGMKSNVIRLPFTVDKIWYKRLDFLILSFLFFLSAIYFYFNALRKKNIRELDIKLQNAQKIMQLEQEALKAQMNPHFIFNCLNAIQHYIIEKDTLSANKFISSFAGLIRQALDNSGRKSISIREEIIFLRSYIEIEQNRFEDRFLYQINVGNDIETSLLQIPPMLVQPFIENAINHGLLHKKNEIGKLELHFSLFDQMLKINISDNGIGRKAAASYTQHKEINHISKGIALTEMRISRLNVWETSKIKLNIEDKYDSNGSPKGTNVEILIPLLFNN